MPDLDPNALRHCRREAGWAKEYLDLPQVVSRTSGAEGDRTLNLSIANAALSQLSYRPSHFTRI
jgi:hypothetical protein